MQSHLINIDTTAFENYTGILRTMHKSDLPLAVRGMLNELAFDMKKNTAPEYFEKNFIIRNKRFFKVHTRVNKCSNTFDIGEMQSQFGIIKGKSKAGDGLEKQEEGGTIPNREYIANNAARRGKKEEGKVIDENYLNTINPKSVTKINGAGKMFKNQRFIRAAFKSGAGKHIQYNRTIFFIRATKKVSRDKMYLHMTPLYSVEPGRSVNLKPRPFMEPAAMETIKKAPDMYAKEAQRRITKTIQKNGKLA